MLGFDHHLSFLHRWRCIGVTTLLDVFVGSALQPARVLARPMFHPVRILSTTLFNSIVCLGAGYSSSNHVYGWLVRAYCALGISSLRLHALTAQLPLSPLKELVVVMKRPAPQIERNIIYNHAIVCQLVAEVVLRRLGGNSEYCSCRLLIEI